MSRIYASADDVANAIVAASRIFKIHPMDVARGAGGDRRLSQARYVAYAGLLSARPGVSKSALARGVGFQFNPSVVNNKLRDRAMKSTWWNEDFVDEVVGAILADELDREAA